MTFISRTRWSTLKTIQKYELILREEFKTFIHAAKLHRSVHLTHARWIGHNSCKVYVRSSERLIEGQMTWVIDIAAVEIAEKYQAKGIFTRFLNFVMRHRSYPAVFIENVMTTKFMDFFLRRKFKPIGERMPRCFYRFTCQNSHRLRSGKNDPVSA